MLSPNALACEFNVAAEKALSYLIRTAQSGSFGGTVFLPPALNHAEFCRCGCQADRQTDRQTFVNKPETQGCC